MNNVVNTASGDKKLMTVRSSRIWSLLGAAVFTILAFALLSRSYAPVDPEPIAKLKAYYSAIGESHIERNFKVGRVTKDGRFLQIETSRNGPVASNVLIEIGTNAVFDVRPGPPIIHGWDLSQSDEILSEGDAIERAREVHRSFENEGEIWSNTLLRFPTAESRTEQGRAIGDRALLRWSLREIRGTRVSLNNQLYTEIEIDANTAAIVGWRGHPGYEIINNEWRITPVEAREIAGNYSWRATPRNPMTTRGEVRDVIKMYIAKDFLGRPVKLEAGYQIHFENSSAILEIEARNGEVYYVQDDHSRR